MFLKQFLSQWSKLAEHSTWVGFSDMFGMTGVINQLQAHLSQGSVLNTLVLL